MAAMTVKQRAKIYAMTKGIKDMNNELLHSYVECLTGKSSIRELTKAEAGLVIDALEGKRNTGDHMTPKQEHYLKALAKEYGWTDETGELDEKRLDGFCRAKYNVMRYSWLTRQQASKVIEGLKAMVERNGGNENEGKGN